MGRAHWMRMSVMGPEESPPSGVRSLDRPAQVVAAPLPSGSQVCMWHNSVVREAERELGRGSCVSRAIERDGSHGGDDR